MLLNHPDIKRVHFKEDYDADSNAVRTLIVETDLKLSDIKTVSAYSSLLDYLTHLKDKDFGGFDKLEIREFGTYNPSLNQKNIVNGTLQA